MSGRVVCFWDGDAWRMGVECSRGAPTRGRNKGQMRVTVVHLCEGRGIVARRIWERDYKARDVQRNGKPYPVRRARAHYRRMARDGQVGTSVLIPMTKGAAKALKEAI